MTRTVVVAVITVVVATACLAEQRGQVAVADSCSQKKGPPLRIAEVIEVTDGSTVYMQPIWSPDGKKLAFTGDGFTGIYVRNADGTGPIKELTSADYSGYKPVWTSDSRAIVVRTRRGIVGQSISLIDVETGEVRELERWVAHPGQPERNIHGDIVVEIDGELKVLDETRGVLVNAEDYYSREDEAVGDVRIEMDFRNSRMWIVRGKQRSQFPGRIALASLSPNRDRVAFGRYDGNIYVSRLDGPSVVNLGPGSRWHWSADGKMLLYLGAIEDSGYDVTASEIFVADVETGGVTQLTDTPDIVEDYPVWSPDGTRIAYSIHRVGKICVAVLERTD